MDYLNGADYFVVGLYFSILVCLGLYLKRRASASLEDYLLGGRRLPWWALGISGMASFLDITGTMIVVSFLFMLGPRGLCIEFRGGAVLVLAVILYYIPKELRRMLLVALIAASMSTFDSTVNKATGFYTRDLYQRYFRPKAPNHELIYASWAFGFAVVAGAFLLAYTVKNINDIWDWIIMGLGGGMIVPLFLRFYWWRYNGEGFAIGMGVGLCGCILQRAMAPGLDPRLQFVVMISVGLAGSLIGTYLTKPTDRRVLENFYRTTRPFGLWGPLKGILSDDVRRRMQREHTNDLLALPFVLCWQATLFLLPMQRVTAECPERSCNGALQCPNARETST